MLRLSAVTSASGNEGKSGFSVAMLAVIASLFLVQASFAQVLPSIIVEANSSNNHINILTFDVLNGTGTADQFNVNTANQNSTIQALGFRAGGFDLVAADRIGKIEIYPNFSEPPVTVCDANDATPGDCPSRPDGIATASDFMAVVDSSPGGSQTARIWSFEVCDFITCPSGFGPGVIIADDVCIGTEVSGVCDSARARLLAETELVRGSFTFDGGAGTGASGDVLILAEDPAALLILPGCAMTGTCAVPQPKVVIPTADFGGVTPTGMTWLNGTPYVLVATNDGVIQTWRLDISGVVRINDEDPFDDGLGNGSLKIKNGTGPDGSAIAVLTRRNHGDAFLYQISLASGEPVADGGEPAAVITSGVESPNGLALVNAGAIDDTSGCDVTQGGCAPAGILQHEFPAGTGNLGFLIESVTHILSDPRPECTTPPFNAPPLAANEFDPSLPSDVIIPGFLCAQNDAYFIVANLQFSHPTVLSKRSHSKICSNRTLRTASRGAHCP